MKGAPGEHFLQKIAKAAKRAAYSGAIIRHIGAARASEVANHEPTHRAEVCEG